MTQTDSTLMTIKQLSAKYDIAEITIHKATSAKELPYYQNKTRGKVYIRENEFENWLTEGFIDRSKIAS